MIRSFSATTREIDDVQAAVAEIMAALNLEKNLLNNSLGIISCFSEFDSTGVLKAICDALPFDCIGATTCLSSANGEVDQMLFVITVLTSDDCIFPTTEILITENYGDSIASAISNMLKKSEEKPKLFLGCFPLIKTVGGDMMLEKIDKATGCIPIFGTMAVDHYVECPTAKTILNGVTYSEAVVLSAIYGNPGFSFEVASLAEDKIAKQKAIITESNGNILIGVNNIPVLEYMKQIGLTEAELARGLGIVPLVVDFNDGTKPVVRAVYSLSPEGHVVCGGLMPVGAAMAIGRIDMGDVLSTTEKTLRQFIEKDSVLFCYSCMARHLVLGAHNTAEAEKVVEVSGGSQYLFASSGGEICPLPDEYGRLKNSFHNYTIVFCKLS